MRPLLRLVLGTSICLSLASTTRAHSDASELSAVSLLPAAISVAAPLVFFSGAVALTVISITAVGQGTVWVLERASDGARFSLTLSGAAVVGTSVAAGAAVTSVALSTGWVLSAAGRAIAFIPNEIGKALLYNERVTR